MRPTMPGITSDDVCDAAGVSYRQLDYWIRHGLVTPIGAAFPGSGGLRRWSRTELRVVWALGRLAELGARTNVLHHVAPMLRAMPAEDWHGALLVGTSGKVWRATDIDRQVPVEACWVINLGLGCVAA